MLSERRIKDPAIREVALRRLADEQLRGVPTYYQTTLEASLVDTEYEKQRFLSQQGRNGGQVKKSDALQQAISDLVRRDPNVTASELENMLTREKFPQLIADVEDGRIHFIQPDGLTDGRLKVTPISGLKDRLSRAKKILKSR